MQDTEAQPPTVMACANLAWNLVNFRAGLIEALVAKGFRVVAVAPEDADMGRRLEAMGCIFRPVSFDAAGVSPSRDMATFWRLYGLIREYRPAAWLSWTIKANAYGAMAARLAGVPAFPNVSGLGTAFIRDNWLTKVAKTLYRAGFARANRVLFENGDDLALFVAEKLIRPDQALRAPGPGIDLTHFQPAMGPRPGPRRFLMVARLLADKGVREYVEAARRLRGEWPDARFGLLGFLDVANRTAISRAEVEGWVADGLIDYHEPVDDVRPYVADCDFLVLPSYREGLSRVLLEAAALARPIVTTDVPGCRDVVTEGVNGFLCEARDAASLHAAMQRAAALPDADWQRMGQAGRERVECEFSVEQVNSTYFGALAQAGVPGF